MIKPTLSIGLTSYNQIQYLDEAILSVLNQTIEPYEFVISDNHSTDGSNEKVLHKYMTNSKIRIIQPPEHLSYREHINFMVNNLSGEWFALLASDDSFKPNFVETFISRLNKNTKNNIVLVRFGYNLINDRGEYLKTIRQKSFRIIQTFPGSLIEELVNNLNPIWASVIRRDIFLNIGGFDERIPVDADWSMICRFSVFGNFQYIPVSISNYRYQYRPDIEKERIELESLDHANMANVIQKQIFLENNLSLRLWKLAVLKNLSNRIKLYKKYELNYDHLFALYKINKHELSKFSILNKFEIYLRMKILKL